MEEPPRIERILSSRGLPLADAAAILRTYVSNIDQYHFHHDGVSSVNDDSDELTAKPRKDRTTSEEDETGEHAADAPPRKSRQEREEESLLAQMDQLANSGKSLSAGMISDDVYERLKTISDSLCAEADGTPRNVCRAASGARAKKNETADDSPSRVDDDAAESEAVESSEEVKGPTPRRPGETTQPQTVEQRKRDKKREKKAKKKAKKQAKKEKRKRKVNDMEQDASG